MFSLHSQQFLLLLVVTTCHLYLVAGAWFPPAKGKIEKKYDMNYVGENLTVFCIKTLDFTGEVYFQQGDLNYSQEYVTKINTTHALLDKPVTDDDFEETTLTCADGDGAVATAQIYTDYAPQNATDLKMVWLHEVNLFINWGFNNIPYKNGHSERLILVTGEWCFNPNESNWRECYKGKLNGATTCEVPNITSNEWVTVYVRVNITNVIRNDLVSTVFPGVRIRDQVKPLPVKSVQVTALNSTAVRVHVGSDYNEQAYNITYYTTWGEEENHTTVMTAKTADKSFDVTDLHPDYHYVFSVSSKYDAHRGYLSDPVDVETRMPEDAPAAGPVVTPGGFYLDRSPCSSEADRTKKKSTAYVYFQELADEDKNGKIESYTATVVVDGTNVTYTQPGTPRTVKLDSVPCDGNFDVTLHAHTAVGPSPGAVLHVPQWTEGNDGGVDKLMLKQNDSKITAEWEATPSLPGVSVLLYYYDKTSADANMCEHSILHVNISTDSGSQVLPNANANMKFGMAAISKDSSTKGMKTNGIQFTDCLYDPKTDPGNNPLEVSAFPQSHDILVSWNALSACDSTRRYIIFNFEIEVCNTETRTSDCKMYPVGASSNSYRLVGVAKDVNYSMRMRANTTSANRPLTDFTDPVFATVQSTVFKLSSGEIAGIVMGVLGVVFVLAMLVFCFCRDKFRALRSKFKKPADIVNPPVNQPPKKAVKDNGFAPSDGHMGGYSNQAYVVTSFPKVVHEQQVSGDSGYSGNNDSPPHSPTEDKTQVIPESRPAGYNMVTSTTGQNPYMPNADTAGLITPIAGIVLSVANQPLGQSQGLFLPLPVPACCQEDDDKDSDKDSDKDKDECVNDDSRASESGNEAYMRCSTADTVPDDAQPPGASTASDTTPPAARPDPAITQPVINFVLADLPAIPVLQDFVDEPDLEDEDGALKEAGPRSEHNPAADSTLQDYYMRLAPASDTTEPGQDHVQQLTAQPGVEASFFPSGDNHPTALQDTEHLRKDALPAGDGNGSGYIETCGDAQQRSPLSSPNVESTQEVEACTPQEGAVNPDYVTKETITSHSHSYQPNQPVGEDESQQSPQAEILTDLSASTQNPLPSTRSEPSRDESPAASECEGSNPEASHQQPPAPLAPPSTAGYLPHPLPPLPAADPQSGPSQRHAEQGGGNDLDNNLNLATQGQPDEVAEDTPLPSAVSSGYVARPEEICDVPQPSSQPVSQERGGGEEGSAQPVAEDAAQCDGGGEEGSAQPVAEDAAQCDGGGEEGSAQPVAEDAAQCDGGGEEGSAQPVAEDAAQCDGGGEEGSAQSVAEDAAHDGSDSGASSMSDAEHSLSSNGSGYVPHQVTLTLSDGLQSPPNNSSVRIEVTGDRPRANNTSYVPLEATLTPGSGGLWQPDDASEDPGNRLTLERLDSGYFSPCATRAARPLFSSDSGQDKVPAVDHNHQAHDTDPFSSDSGQDKVPAVDHNHQAHHTDPSSTHSHQDGETVTTGEGVGVERQGGTLGGTLIMSSQARLTSSGYVERKDSPSATSTD